MAGNVLPALSKLSALLHTRKSEHRLDTLVLSLHHRATTRLLLLAAFVVSTRSLAGEPIECTTDAGVPRQLMNSYCFVTATFSVTDSGGGDGVRGETPAGLGPGGAVRSHAYYQWVPFVFCLQALAFYLPYALWKHSSGSVLRDCFAFQLDQPDTTLHASSTKLMSFAGYLSARMGKANQNLVKTFFATELACLLNVIGNLFIIDLFLGVDFGRYCAARVAALLVASPPTADLVFPPLAKCTFARFGASGTLERVDAVCVLPHNVFNEKLFVFVWLWTALLAALTIVYIVFRAVTLAVPKVRRSLLLAMLVPELREHGRQVFEQCTVADWFLLCQIGKHMDSLAFSELVRHLAASHQELLLPAISVALSRRASQWSDGHRRSADQQTKLTP